ncbi:hypothetical protein KHA80_15345 [Anaerobacillus sp. HL2]|nr:hypothetical protein KHA80_15345 [Anaerobacillus sp. HL2]
MIHIFSSFLPQVFQAAIVPLLILIIVFSQNILSGIIMLVTAPLIPVFMIIIGSMSEKKSREQWIVCWKFSGHFLDVLQGLPILKVFGQTKRQRMKILEMSNQFRDTTMEVLKNCIFIFLCLKY